MSETNEARAAARLRFKPHGAYKDSGVEWLGKIPAHWDPLKLSESVPSPMAIPSRARPAWMATWRSTDPMAPSVLTSVRTRARRVW